MIEIVNAEEMDGETFVKHLVMRHFAALAGIEAPANFAGPVDEAYRAFHRHLHKTQEGLEHEHER